MESTIVTEYNLVCDRLPLQPVIGSSYMAAVRSKGLNNCNKYIYIMWVSLISWRLSWQTVSLDISLTALAAAAWCCFSPLSTLSQPLPPTFQSFLALLPSTLLPGPGFTNIVVSLLNKQIWYFLHLHSPNLLRDLYTCKIRVRIAVRLRARFAAKGFRVLILCHTPITTICKHISEKWIRNSIAIHLWLQIVHRIVRQFVRQFERVDGP
jgi:hypothetical protein